MVQNGAIVRVDHHLRRLRSEENERGIRYRTRLLRDRLYGIAYSHTNAGTASEALIEVLY